MDETNYLMVKLLVVKIVFPVSLFKTSENLKTKQIGNLKLKKSAKSAAQGAFRFAHAPYLGGSLKSK